MLASILCPGPSLARLTKAPSSDVLIAVNRTAFLFHANIWATLDKPFIREAKGKVLGSPALFTREEYRPDYKGKVISVEQMAGYFPGIVKFAQFTAPTALLLAGWIGATHIRCYGCDMSGDGGIDRANAEGRTESRWKRERLLFSQAVEFLEAKGVTVKRWT